MSFFFLQCTLHWDKPNSVGELYVLGKVLLPNLLFSSFLPFSTCPFASSDCNRGTALRAGGPRGRGKSLTPDPATSWLMVKNVTATGELKSQLLDGTEPSGTNSWHCFASWCFHILSKFHPKAVWTACRSFELTPKLAFTSEISRRAPILKCPKLLFQRLFH